MTIETFAVGLLKTLVTTLNTVVRTIYFGYVLSLFWLWFLVPLGAMVINTSQAIGINLVIELLMVGLYQGLEDIKVKLKDPDATIFGRLMSDGFEVYVIITLVWFIGWVWHLFLV